MALWTALTIGFMGSFHCIGMCGPIALALPVTNRSGMGYVGGKIIYNMGRLVSYGILGGVFGLIGHSVALAGFQSTLSVLLGLGVIASVFLKSNSWSSISGILPLAQLKGLLQTQLKKQGMKTMFIIGILNGMLPCGLVYMGVAGSLTLDSAVGGSVYMVVFGLGTVPVMLALSVAPGFISMGMRQRINRLIPVFMVLFGIFLIVRGFMMETGH